MDIEEEADDCVKNDLQSAENTEYEVENILESRRSVSNSWEFLIHWKGFPSSFDTWEPECNLDGCDEILKKFWTRKKKQRRNGKQKIREADSKRTAERYEKEKSLSKSKEAEQRKTMKEFIDDGAAEVIRSPFQPILEKLAVQASVLTVDNEKNGSSRIEARRQRRRWRRQKEKRRLTKNLSCNSSVVPADNCEDKSHLSEALESSVVVLDSSEAVVALPSCKKSTMKCKELRHHTSHKLDVNRSMEILLGFKDPSTSEYHTYSPTPALAPLIEAVLANDSERIRIAFMSSPEEINSGESPALLLAAERGLLDSCRTLLELGALPNVRASSTGRTPLMVAVDQGHILPTSWLIHYGAHLSALDQRGESSLTLAMRQGRLAFARLLLKHGAPFSAVAPNIRCPMQLADGLAASEMKFLLEKHVQFMEKALTSTIEEVFASAPARIVNTITRLYAWLPHELEELIVDFNTEHVPSLQPGFGNMLVVGNALCSGKQLLMSMRSGIPCPISSFHFNQVHQVPLHGEGGGGALFSMAPLLPGANRMILRRNPDLSASPPRLLLLLRGYRVQLI